MKELGSCVPPISGEHVVSASVCQVLMGDGEFSVSGVPWLEAGEIKLVAPITAKCLCVKHNSALSPLDAAAHYFFSSLKLFVEADGGSRHALISGHDLERWLLKTVKSAAVSKNLACGGKPLSGAFSRDQAILDMLDAPQHWPKGSGLYSIMTAGDITENIARFQFQPFVNEKGKIEFIAVNFAGFRFVSMLDAPDFDIHPFLRHAKYRPSRIKISYPNSTDWLTLSWEDQNTHEALNLEWVRRTA